MYKSILVKFPSGIMRKVRYNTNTKSAAWNYHSNGVQKMIPGKVVAGSRFKFKNEADEQLFLSHYTPKRNSYDNYNRTTSEKYADGRKRRVAKLSAFCKENPDRVLCADGRHRRVYYYSLSKTSGYVTMYHDNKEKRVSGRIHNGVFTHNAKFNPIFRRQRVAA